MAAESRPLPHLAICSVLEASRIGRARGYGVASGPSAVPKISAAQLRQALAEGATFVTVRFERASKHKTEMKVVVNNEMWIFPTDEARYLEVEVLPVLLTPFTPSTFRRYGLLSPKVGSINEVVLRVNRFAWVGDDGKWLPELTRVLPCPAN